MDDQPPFRAVARTVVSLTDGFEVVGEAATGDDAVTMAHELEPAVVLMDINLPGINGVEAARRILAARPATRLVLLSTYSYDDLPADARSVGVRYVHKEDFGPAVMQELAGGSDGCGT